MAALPMKDAQEPQNTWPTTRSLPSGGSNSGERKEGRASPRFLMSPGNYVLYVETGSGATWRSGAIQDLSLHGVFVVNSNPLPAGTNLTLGLRLSTQAIPLKGVVRRSVDGEGMGIQFTSVASEVKNRLETCLSGLAERAGEAPMRKMGFVSCAW